MEVTLIYILFGIGISCLLTACFFLIFLAAIRPSSEAAMVNYVLIVIFNLALWIPTAIWACLELVKRLKRYPDPDIPKPSTKY